MSRHYVQFTALPGEIDITVGCVYGVVRPDWDVEAETDHHFPEIQDGHSFFDVDSGESFPGEASWNGMQTAEQDDRVGMLLDLVSARIPRRSGGELV